MTTQDNLRVHASKIVFCRVALIFQVRKSWFHADHVTPQVYRSEPVLKGLKKIWRTSKQSSRPGNRQLRAPGVEDPWFLSPFLVPLPELQMVDLPANNIGMLEGNWLVWGILVPLVGNSVFAENPPQISPLKWNNGRKCILEWLVYYVDLWYSWLTVCK